MVQLKLTPLFAPVAMNLRLIIENYMKVSRPINWRREGTGY